MIVDLDSDTEGLLEKVKKELGRPLSDNEVIEGALTCYYSYVLQVNRAKR